MQKALTKDQFLGTVIDKASKKTLFTIVSRVSASGCTLFLDVKYPDHKEACFRTLAEEHPQAYVLSQACKYILKFKAVNPRSVYLLAANNHPEDWKTLVEIV